MSAFVPPLAPLTVLAFLATAFLLIVGAALLLYAVMDKKRALARTCVVAAGVIVLGYCVALFTASATSQERVLQHGDLKYFCEIDCHLAYSVAKVERTPEIGNPPNTIRASGMFHVVALRVWFDPATTSPKRPDMPLIPNPRIVYVEDASGSKYAPSADGLRAMIAMGRTSTPLTQPLKAGESYLSYLVFDLPEGARRPRLFLGTAGGEAALLIGHEMSPQHKKVWFSLL